MAHADVGDEFSLQGPDGTWWRYRVSSRRVVDTRQEPWLVRSPATGTLVLVTCYPFDAIAPGGPLRLVFSAVPRVQ